MFFGLLLLLGSRNPTRRKSIELSLDADGGHRSVLSGSGRFGDRVFALLLAGAQDGRHEVDVDCPGHAGCRGDPGNDCFGRRDRLAHTHRRRNDHAGIGFIVVRKARKKPDEAALASSVGAD